jgi:hypothetical protein
MSEIIRERSPRSRGRVRCDRCGRHISDGEQYSQHTFVDRGSACDVIECMPCVAAGPHLARWLYGCGYEGDWGPSEAYEWAQEVMGRSPADDYLFAYADVGGWVYYLEDLADSAAECAAADADPARAWDDEAWAAFTWRMQTSPAFTPTN